MLKYCKTPPKSDRKPTYSSLPFDESPRPSTSSFLPANLSGQRLSNPIPTQLTSSPRRHIPPHGKINRIFSWHNDGVSNSSTISRLASSLISPIRSRGSRSFLQAQLPRYRSAHIACRGRSSTSELFGLQSGSASWTSFPSLHSRSRSRDEDAGLNKKRTGSRDSNSNRLSKNFSRSRECYPRPNKRKHSTWDLNDLERLKKLSIVNRDFLKEKSMSVVSAIVSGSGAYDEADRLPTGAGRYGSFPQRIRRTRSSTPATRRPQQRQQQQQQQHSARPSLAQSARGRSGGSGRGRGRGRDRDSTSTARQESLSPQRRGCYPRSQSAPRSYRVLSKALRSVLVLTVAPVVPITFGRRGGDTKHNQGSSTSPVDKPRSCASTPSTAGPAESTGAVRKTLIRTTTTPVNQSNDTSSSPNTRRYASAEAFVTQTGVETRSNSSKGRAVSLPNRNFNESTKAQRKVVPYILFELLKEQNKYELDRRFRAARRGRDRRDKRDTTESVGHVSRRELHQIQKDNRQTMENRTIYPRPELHLKCNRGSHSSDTSSAYSGSDTMTSLHSSALDGDEVDLSGLVESIVDSDEDDLVESMESLNVRDAVRECLEKDPSERTEEDIETLLEFTQGLKAFTNITLAVRRALCSVMVFAVVDKAGTIVMSDGEELDSWSVLINGHVEIDHGNGEKEELQMGDSFGILPTMDKLYHRGVMKTKCNDCQFVCITQTDYYRIQHQGEENTKRHEEDGKVVMVTELRQIGPDTNVGSAMKRGHVVIRGTIERLLLQLVEENSMTDPTYVEDFLLTHRTFIRNPQEVASKLLSWFENEEAGTSASPQEIRDRVTRVVLLWVNNHFTDFETDTEMMEFLETFESGLERKNLLSQLRLLHIACAAKARTRTVTLARSSRDENLNFSFVGGYERGGYGIFISKVEKNSKPDDVGLKRGDQILEVNGQSFEHVTNARAMEIIMGSTHLSITVKSNLLAFKEMIQSPDSNSPRPRTNPRRICASDIAKLHGNADARPAMLRLSSADMLGHDQVDCCPSPFRERESSTNGSLVGGIATASHFVAGLLGTSGSSKKDSSTLSVASSNNSTSSSSSSMSTSTGHQKGGFMTLGPKRRLQKALIKMNLLPKNTANSASIDASDATLLSSEGGVGACHDDGRNANAASSNAATSSNYNTGGNLAGLYHSRSNPDLTSTIYYEDTRQMDYPEHVLKVYKSDQTCKYLLINKETTAHEVVMLALQEFGIHETSSNFSLCEVSVGEGGMIKQRRLPEQLQNLAERIGLASRYYLKTNGITETLVPDDLALDLVRESTVHFLQLNANEVAIQLTFQDFAIFRQIESTEYVDDLFELKSKYGVPMLKQFAELVNREMFWVVTEVCSEHNIVRRMKIVKQFIKIARHCKECRNFNSMFAIVSGLGHAAVTRLRQTWEKLPSKYQKLFADLQDLMDPSRNMSKYRQLVSAEFLAQHPIIPFYPVVKKDLTFIHLGNDTKVENLINFEKLRMIAKEVRILTHMCSSTYDLLTMLEFKGQPPSSAMVALNQMSVSSGPHHIHGSSGQATVKRRKKSTAAPNPKKMFEEAQMVRRVKAYLNNMKVITDEDVLHGLSLECEPSATSSNTGGSTGGGGGGGGGAGGGGGGGGGSISGGSAPSSVTIRKRHPSPTLSTTSSTSSTSEGRKGGLGPKFGTASPQAVKKILSLSEPTKTRPYQPRHPGIMLPLAGHPHTFHYALHSSISPSPSPGAHRRMGSGTGVSVSGTRAVHERSHSDTPTPLPSVDLSVESSSVTSFSNLPLRKTMTSGSVTSSDSGHGSYVQPDVHLSNYTEGNSNNTTGGGGLYHLNVQLSSNASTTSPKLQQRRHSAIHAPGFYYNTMALPTSPTIVTAVNQLEHHSGIAGRKAASPTPPPPLPHPKSALDERLIGLSLHQQYHHSQIPPLPPPTMHGQQMKNGSATASGMCVDGNLGFAPAAVRNLQYHPLPPPPQQPPPPLVASVHASQEQHRQQQQQQQAFQHHLQQHHQHQQQQQQQLNSQYHASRNVGHGVLVNSLVPPTKGPRYPPSYTVAAHMARLHRLGRAQSLERVANSMQTPTGCPTGSTTGLNPNNTVISGNPTASYYQQHELGDEDDDSETQVSAV